MLGGSGVQALILICPPYPFWLKPTPIRFEGWADPAGSGFASGERCACASAGPMGPFRRAAPGCRRLLAGPRRRAVRAAWAAAAEGRLCRLVCPLTASRVCEEVPAGAGALRSRAVAPEVGLRRVGTGLPARCRRSPGWVPAASGRFADAGSCSVVSGFSRASRRRAGAPCRRSRVRAGSSLSTERARR